MPLWYFKDFLDVFGIFFVVAILGYMALKIGKKTATKATIVLCILAALFFLGGNIFGLVPAIACIAYDVGRSMKKK